MEKQILKDTADAITEKPVQITIDILHPTWWQRLRKQTKKTYCLQPASLGTLVKVSKAFLSIEITAEEKGDFMPLVQKLMYAHGETLATIVAIAIVNRKEDPPKSLIQFLLHNLTAKEISILAGNVLNQMDITSFMKTIISIKGVNVLEMSPKEQGS